MTKDSLNNYEYFEAVRYLESLSYFSDIRQYAKDTMLDKFLERTKYFLKLAGSPEKDLKVIHIAGTSGKGSVSELVHQQLVNSGHTAGLFTSPFATTSIEKIKVNDLFIEPRAFANILERLKPLIDQAYLDGPYGAPSYFELFLVISLIYFKETGCEWAVLETGLGGRYDATNAVGNTVVAALTNVDYDHTDILGKTLTKIARDKSGITKKGSIFITGEQRPHLVSIMREECDRVGVKRFIQVKANRSMDQNHTLASRIISEAGLGDFNESLQVNLPCRFEKIQDTPLVILDGAHNEAKVSYTLNRLKKYDYKRLIVVFAIAKDKNVSKVIQKIVPKADEMYLTRFVVTHRESASPHNLLKQVRQIDKNNKATVMLDPFRATEEAIRSADDRDIILVIGSFFLAGDIRKIWYPEEYILNNRKIS